MNNLWVYGLGAGCDFAPATTTAASSVRTILDKPWDGPRAQLRFASPCPGCNNRIDENTEFDLPDDFVVEKRKRRTWTEPRLKAGRDYTGDGSREQSFYLRERYQ